MQLIKTTMEHLDFMLEKNQEAIDYYEAMINREYTIKTITLIQKLHRKYSSSGTMRTTQEKYQSALAKLAEFITEIEKDMKEKTAEGDRLLKITKINIYYKYETAKRRLANEMNGDANVK